MTHKEETVTISKQRLEELERKEEAFNLMTRTLEATAYSRQGFPKIAQKPRLIATCGICDVTMQELVDGYYCPQCKETRHFEENNPYREDKPLWSAGDIISVERDWYQHPVTLRTPEAHEAYLQAKEASK